MRKNILYLGIAVIIGIIGGYLLFSNSTATINQEIANSHSHSQVSENQMWTCSMHPQIMQQDPGDCPICGMDLIPAESSAEGLSVNEIKMTDNAMALANIQTIIVERFTNFNNDGLILISGKIAVNKENNTIQASYFDGRIEKLNVSYEGQKVNNGELLATVYSPNLVAAQQELIAATSLKQSQPELYKAVRNKFKNWKFSESQINAIEQSGKVTENFPLYVTVSGTVNRVLSAEGDYVKQGQPIVKLSNLNSVWAEFDVYENQISKFKKGQKIVVATNAYPNKEFEAEISFIDPVLNNQTRTVTVRATLNNKGAIFKPGMFITGKIKGNTTNEESLITIPVTAVLWTGKRSLVYIKNSTNEPIFEMREVTLGNRNGAVYSIISGLKSGDEIVTNGTFTVDAAAQLQGKKSMMNRAGGKTMTGHEGHLEAESLAIINESTQMEEMKFPEAFQKNFSEAIIPYFKMKDAFIASDIVQVVSFANSTTNSFKSLITQDLGEAEKTYLKKILVLLNLIATKNNLKNQREFFVQLNEYIVAIVKNIKSPTQLLYIQKCPMANNNKGAIWLSMEEEIKNPYFGDLMLSCGEIQDIIKINI